MVIPTLSVIGIADLVIPVLLYLLYLVVTTLVLAVGNMLVVYGYLSEILAPQPVSLRYAQNAMRFILRETARRRHPALMALLSLYALHVIAILLAPYLILYIADHSVFTRLASILIMAFYPLLLLKYGRFWAKMLLRLRALPEVTPEMLGSDPSVQEALSYLGRKLNIEGTTPYLCAPPKNGRLFICFPGQAAVDLKIGPRKRG